MKDLRFSDVWAEKFRLWQERVLAMHELGGDLQTAIKNFAFAKQRFDSFCRPLIMVLCCLVPIVCMVVMIAEDPRDSESRKKSLGFAAKAERLFCRESGPVR